MEEQEEEAPVPKTQAEKFMAFLTGRNRSLREIVHRLDLARLDAFQKSEGIRSHQHGWRRLVQQLIAMPNAAPFHDSQSVPGMLSFPGWLTWAGLCERDPVDGSANFPLFGIVVEETFVAGEEAEKERIEASTVQMPQLWLSLVLYYAAYARNVQLLHRRQREGEEDAVTRYHRLVPETLAALQRVRERSLKLNILAKSTLSPHNLFHQLYGVNRKIGFSRPIGDDEEEDERLYLPAQFYFHNWLSVSVDCSTFRLHAAALEFYWIGVRFNFSLHRIALTNARDVQTIFAADMHALEELIVQWDDVDERGRDPLHDFLGVEYGIVKGAPHTRIIPRLGEEKKKSAKRTDELHLRHLTLQHMSTLLHLFDPETVPQLDFVHLENVSGNVETFLRGLAQRTRRIKRAGHSVLPIGSPSELALIHWGHLDNADMASWYSVSKRAVSLTLGYPFLRSLPIVNPAQDTLVNLTLQDMVHLGEDAVQPLIHGVSKSLLHLCLNYMDGVDTADMLGRLMAPLAKLESFALIKMKTRNLEPCLRDKHALRILNVIPSAEGIGMYSIPYASLPSLVEERGFLVLKPNEKITIDSVLPLTPSSATARRRHFDIAKARAALEQIAFMDAQEDIPIYTRSGGDAIVMTASPLVSSSGAIKTNPLAVDLARDPEGDVLSQRLLMDALVDYGPVMTGGVEDWDMSLPPPPWIAPHGGFANLNAISSLAAWTKEVDDWFGADTTEGILFYPTFTTVLDAVIQREQRHEDGTLVFRWETDPLNMDHKADLEELIRFFGFQLTLLRRARLIDEETNSGSEELAIKLRLRTTPDPARGDQLRIAALEEPVYNAADKSEVRFLQITYHDNRNKTSIPLGTMRIDTARGFTCTLHRDGVLLLFATQTLVSLAEKSEQGAIFDNPALVTQNWTAGAVIRNNVVPPVNNMMALLNEYKWDTESDILQQLVRRVPERATFSETLLFCYMLCLGIRHLASGVVVTTLSKHARALLDTFAVPVGTWITAAPPIHTELVALSGEDDDEDGSEMLTGEEGGETPAKSDDASSMVDIFNEMYNHAFDSLSKLATLFQAGTDDDYADLIDILIEARARYLAEGDDEDTYIAKMVEALFDFDQQLEDWEDSRKLSADGAKRIRELLIYIRRDLFGQIRQPFVDVTRALMPEELDDPNVVRYYSTNREGVRTYNFPLIRRYIEQTLPASRVIAIGEDMTASFEDVLDILEAAEMMAVASASVSPQKIAKEQEVEQNRKRIQTSPGRLGDSSAKQSSVKRSKLVEASPSASPSASPVRRFSPLPSPSPPPPPPGAEEYILQPRRKLFEGDDEPVVAHEKKELSPEDDAMLSIFEAPVVSEMRQHVNLFEGRPKEDAFKKRHRHTNDDVMVIDLVSSSPEASPPRRIAPPARKREKKPDPADIIDLTSQLRQVAAAVIQNKKTTEEDGETADLGHRQQQEQEEEEKATTTKKRIQSPLEGESLEACFACGKEHVPLEQCSQCKVALYCGRQCQAAHWGVHKSACKIHD